MNNIELSAYQTNKTSYKTWIDHIFGDKIIVIIFRLIIYCGIPFIFGLIISQQFSFVHNYITTLPIYLGFFGIMLTCLMLIYGNSNIHGSFAFARPCFTITDDSYKKIIDTNFRKCASLKLSIYSSIILFVYAMIALGYSYYKFNNSSNGDDNIIMNSLFVKKNWYNVPYKELKFLILLIYALFCSFPLGTAALALIVNVKLILNLFRLPVIPIPNLIYSRLEPLTDFYLKISISWFTGVSLFVIIFIRNLDLTSIIFISFLSIIGILTFLIPQLLYRNMIAKSRSSGTSIAIKKIYSLNEIQFNEVEVEQERPNELLLLKDLFDEKSFQLDISDVINVEKKWIYNPFEILLFVFSQSVPFLIVYLKNYL